ncbi:hypothetical protein GQ44DRAFT_198262 [Phaeosphaeriaceae sp. PMI808]|nr:hypothetical protein GQ44DRAFT_198262 [Phaeosphaeriaceae sp. PMI808]
MYQHQHYCAFFFGLSLFIFHLFSRASAASDGVPGPGYRYWLSHIGRYTIGMGLRSWIHVKILDVRSNPHFVGFGVIRKHWQWDMRMVRAHSSLNGKRGMGHE